MTGLQVLMVAYVLAVVVLAGAFGFALAKAHKAFRQSRDPGTLIIAWYWLGRATLWLLACGLVVVLRWVLFT